MPKHPHPHSLPTRGREAHDHIPGVAQCSSERGTGFPPLDGEGLRVGWSHEHRLIHLIPLLKTSRILPPSPRMGGLQANSGGAEPGGSFASPTGPSPDGSVCATRPVLFQKPALRDGERLSFYLLRGVSRLGVRPFMQPETPASSGCTRLPNLRAKCRSPPASLVAWADGGREGCQAQENTNA